MIVDTRDANSRRCKITSFGQLLCILRDYNLAVELTLYRASRNVNSGFASYRIQRHFTHILLASDITIILLFALAVASRSISQTARINLTDTSDSLISFYVHSGRWNRACLSLRNWGIEAEALLIVAIQSNFLY